ncbi:hypothetical protein D3C84_337310 [compost metagenome]
MVKINYNINGNGIATEKKICEQMHARMIFHILKFNFEIHFFEIDIVIAIVIAIAILICKFAL